MGKVSFSTYVRVAGCYEPYENVYAYLYCDKCGSFALESHICLDTRTQVMVKALDVVGTLLITGSAWWLTHNWILCAVPIVIGLLIFVCIDRTTHLACKKCGNNNITDINVLNYQANDFSVLDIPDALVVKEYVHSIIPAM
jgi:hypothetical protein